MKKKRPESKKLTSPSQIPSPFIRAKERNRKYQRDYCERQKKSGNVLWRKWVPQEIAKKLTAITTKNGLRGDRNVRI